MRVLFCPVRSLAAKADTVGNCVAGISSSSALEDVQLPDISYVFGQYADLDVETPGRSFSMEDAAAFATFMRQPDGRTDTVFCCWRTNKNGDPKGRLMVYLSRYLWTEPQEEIQTM